MAAWKERQAASQASQPQAPTRAIPATSADPTQAQVLGWVDQLGLAGAVDQIRADTGWDFQRAAHFLANVMRNRREGRP
jgi:hypothetical protein